MVVTQEHRKLFTPLQLGNMKLSHRIIMSPLTRSRCPGGLPNSLVAEMYAQRATPGGLLISEGVQPSFMAGNMHDIPNIYANEHIQAWKLVTERVHAKGGYIACQLWHVGRFAVSIQLGGRQPLSASATNMSHTNMFTPTGRVPNETAKAMTNEDIKVTIDDHVHAALCAIEAGFDAVEITAANGWLCDQFLNSKTNLRTDNYGGSVENRSRFVLELLDAVIAAIGPTRTGIRFSPWGTFAIPLDADPLSTYTYLLSEVEKRGIAYVCLAQPRSDMFLPESTKWGVLQTASKEGKVAATIDEISLKPFIEVLRTTVRLGNGGYDGKNCFEDVENGDFDAISFGKCFISNPDLVAKIKNGETLTPWRADKFYASGPDGYSDYPLGEMEKTEVSGN